MSGTPGPLRVALLHPALGFGGSERVVVDAATELAGRGHDVVVYTAERDRGGGFASGAGFSLDVRVRGGFLPRQLAGRLRVPCNAVRMAWLATALARESPDVDVVFCDLVPHFIPLARRRLESPIVYYGHYPDLLLTPPRRGWYRLYRSPLDRLEARALESADLLLVNSRFSAEAFRRHFPALGDRRIEIVHPGVAVPPEAVAPGDEAGGDLLLLAIGRIAPEKNLELVVATLDELRHYLPGELHARVRVVIAGSYDGGREAGATLGRLRSLARERGVAEQVEIRTSITEQERLDLLRRSRCVVHPHPAEHFGIVPLEAMAAARPVVAVNRGGPLETVVDGETGLLCEPAPDAFARAVARLLLDPDEAWRMGRAGRDRAASRFSRAAMGARLETLLRGLVERGATRRSA